MDKVRIVEPDGFLDGYDAHVIPGLHAVPQEGRPALTIISREDGTVLAVESRTVFELDGITPYNPS
jgi:hypothetical protein